MNGNSGEHSEVTFPGRLVADDRSITSMLRLLRLTTIVLHPVLPLVAVARKQRPAIDHYLEAPRPCFILELVSSTALAEVYS